MRPLIVLLAVAAAVGGLFFALQKGGGEGDAGPQDSDTPIVRRGADETAETSVDDTPLEGLTEGARRETAKIEASPVAVDPDVVAADPIAGVGDLTGKVVDEKGRPIVGAEVTLTLFGSQNILFAEVDRSKDVKSETGDDGVYRFAGVPVRDGWSVIADHIDYSKGELPSVIVLEGSETEAPDLVLFAGSTVRGRVTDTGGNPVPGARIMLSENRFAPILDEDDGSTKYEVETGDDGTYAIVNVAPMQNYSLSVNADGYGSIQVTPLAVVANEDTVQELVLEVAAMLGGSVVSALGEPIENASVEAWAVDRTKRSSHTKVMTDDVGGFMFTNIPTGEFMLVVRHPAHQASSSTRASSGDMQVQISLQPLPTITGRVVDATTGAPLPSFEVQLRQTIQGSADGQTQADKRSRKKFEDPEGRFELVTPKAGTYLVEGIAPGYAATYSEPFETVLNQSTSGIVVRMSRGGTITGRVLGAGGAPLAGAIVETHDKTWSSDPFGQMLFQSGLGDATDTSTRTDANGVYTLSALKPAGYQLRIRHKDYASKSVADLTLEPDQELKVPDVKLPRGATVSGEVIGPSGALVAGAQVQAVPMTAGLDVKRTQTGPDGTYVLEHVPADHDLLLGSLLVRRGTEGVVGAAARADRTDPVAAGGHVLE
ncbi:MAG: carboxypeptidase-like regulatory domain-containing protein, partial [Planctomycetota bacterium]